MIDIAPEDTELRCHNSSKKQYYSNKRDNDHILQRIFLILLEPIYIFYLYFISRSDFISGLINSNPKRLNIGFIITTIGIITMNMFVQYYKWNIGALLFTSLILINMFYLLYKEIKNGKGYPVTYKEIDETDEDPRVIDGDSPILDEEIEEEQPKELNKKNDKIITWEE